MAARRIHPTVPQQVRDRLADHKAAGVSFDVAWERAIYRLYVRGIESRDWHAALEATRDEWRAAYEGQWTPLAPLAGLGIEDLLAGGQALGEAGELKAA